MNADERAASPAPGRPKAGEIPSGDRTRYPAGEGRTSSPCISVCRMDERSGWCEGCLRTLDEIAAWSVMDEADKQAVWDALPQRRVVFAASQGRAA